MLERRRGGIVHLFWLGSGSMGAKGDGGPIGGMQLYIIYCNISNFWKNLFNNILKALKTLKNLLTLQIIPPMLRVDGQP